MIIKYSFFPQVHAMYRVMHMQYCVCDANMRISGWSKLSSVLFTTSPTPQNHLLEHWMNTSSSMPHVSFSFFFLSPFSFLVAFSFFILSFTSFIPFMSKSVPMHTNTTQRHQHHPTLRSSIIQKLAAANEQSWVKLGICSWKREKEKKSMCMCAFHEHV